MLTLHYWDGYRQKVGEKNRFKLLEIRIWVSYHDLPKSSRIKKLFSKALQLNWVNGKDDLILNMTSGKQDKSSELIKHCSPDSSPARNEVIMKTTNPVNQESATKSVVIIKR